LTSRTRGEKFAFVASHFCPKRSFARIFMAQEQHVRAAIDAADAAKEAWSKTPPAERERILFRAVDESE